MATSTAKVATAASRVATYITSMPSRVGWGTGVMALAILDLEIDHLGHDEDADPHPHHAAEAGDDQPLIAEEVAHIFGADPPDEQEHDEGQRADDPGRSLGLRRHRPDLELHLGALAQHVGEG